MKRKILCCGLVFVLAIATFTGCGSDTEDAAQTAEQADAGLQDVNDPAADSGADTTETPGDSEEPETEVATEINARKDRFMLPEITMLTGEYVDLQYQFAKPMDPVTWESSDPYVVRVGKNGSRIKARHEGEAVVEGTTEDGAHRFRCTVTVEPKPESIIYMTFDDGPSRYSTPKVLDILAKNDVKATFFELKPAQADYDLTQRVIDEGHTLAIHGYQHKYDQIYRSDEAYHENLTKLQRLFYRKFKIWCTQTRFPGGSSNTISRHYSTGIMSRLTKKIHGWGFLYQDWNVSSGDAGGANTPDQVFNMVKSGLAKGRSNVILMHDFSGNDKTINALQRIIDYGKSNGFVFRAMTAATGEVHHGVNN